MPEQQTPDNGRKKRRALLIFGAVAMAGIAAGLAYNAYRRTHISTDNAFVEGNVYVISARVSGTVRAVPVSDNQQVKRGNILVELDPADHRSRAEAARANRDLQQANLRLAEQERRRAEALFAQDVSTAERRDKAVSSHEMALAQLRLAEEQLRQAELNLGYTTVTAPADGQVTRKSVQRGNYLQAGQPLMAVVGLDDLWVVANFKETQVERIRPGQEVRIKIDSYPGVRLAGRVESIMAGTGASFSLFPAENATGNYVKVVQRIPVRIRLDDGTDAGRVLRVGMSVVPTVLAK